MSNLSGVTNFFSTANEGFSCTLTSGILASATLVPLSNTTGLTDGTVFVGIIEPTGTKQQAFTGTVDILNSQIKNVVWTRGTNVAHSAGVTIVDYVTGTDWNMMSAGILKHANQAGNLNPTAMYDTNGNKTLELPATASAVNDLAIGNASTGNAPYIQAKGNDSNVGINIITKGVDANGAGLRYNNVGFRALPKDWSRAIVASEIPSLEGFEIGGTMVSGTGFFFPGNYASAWKLTAQNSTHTIKIYLDAGTYTFRHYFFTSSSSGSHTFNLTTESGTTFAATGIDCYVAGSGWLRSVTTGNNITHGGYFQFQMTNPTKNASSSGYDMAWKGTQILRTA